MTRVKIDQINQTKKTFFYRYFYRYIKIPIYTLYILFFPDLYLMYMLDNDLVKICIVLAYLTPV